MSSQLEEFLDSMANECDEKTLRSIKAKEIFYQVSYTVGWVVGLLSRDLCALSHDFLCMSHDFT